MALRGWAYAVTSVVDGEEALREVRRPDGPNLVILDWTMPRVDGIEVCRAIRSGRGEEYIYAILLTSRDRHDDVIEGLEAGADDYITKPFDIRELQARVRTGARIVELQRELIAAREQVRHKAMYDTLTGLLTRGAFFEIFERELAQAIRSETTLSLIITDLDHFKQVNDRHGHLVGDEVLRETARRLSSIFRRGDSVGRYGGEEFIVLAPGCGPDNAMRLAERFRTSICEVPFETLAGPITVTTCAGVASSSSPGDLEGLLKAADEALYRAKEGGRNLVRAA
jgi:diguanylate cyclase (GGDEF)-like protein